MLVSFWSTHHGQAGVTTNLISLSLAISLSKNLRVLVSHTQYGESSLERALVSDIEEYLGGALSNYGLEPVLRLAKNGLLNTDNFSDYTIPLLKNNGYDLLIGTRKQNLSEGEKKNYEDTMLQILKMANDKYDLTFVDLAGGLMNELSQRALLMSDIVVININQNNYSLEKLKEADFIDKIKGKVIYCIGRYDSGIKSNVKNIARRHKLKNIISVPYSPRLIDVINRGDIVEYFGRNILNKKKGNTPFFKEILKSTDAIIKYMDE